MIEIADHNKEDCIRLLNMIICEMPLIKSFSDQYLLSRLVQLTLVVDTSYDFNDNYSHLICSQSEDEPHLLIKQWLLRHYNAKYFIDNLDFNDSEDRTKVAILIINILFKLRHSLKDIEQYLEECESFTQFDEQLNDITRFDKLLEILQNDLNKWKSKARYFKVKLNELTKQMDKYERNQAFNISVSCNNNSYKNQNLLDDKLLNSKPNEDFLTDQILTENLIVNQCQKSKSLNIIRNNDRTEIVNKANCCLIGGYAKSVPINVPKIEQSILCPLCDKYFATNYEYNSHVLKDHTNLQMTEMMNKKSDRNKALFKCTFNGCGKQFLKCYELKRHFVTHQPQNNRPLFFCDWPKCDKKYTALNHLRSHQKFKHVITNAKSNKSTTNCLVSNQYFRRKSYQMQINPSGQKQEFKTNGDVTQFNNNVSINQDLNLSQDPRNNLLESDDGLLYECKTNGGIAHNNSNASETEVFKRNGIEVNETLNILNYSALIDHQYL